MGNSYTHDQDWAGLMVLVNKTTGIATIKTVGSKSAEPETIELVRRAGDLLLADMRKNPDPNLPVFETVQQWKVN